MTKEKKDCNCKAKKDINKLVKTIDAINLSSSKTHFEKRNFFSKSLLKVLKYLIYTILIIFSIVLLLPFLLFIFLFSAIFKKPIVIKIPFLNSLKQINNVRK